MAQPLNPQPDCLDFELLPATPLVPNAGSIRVYADSGTGQLAAIDENGNSAFPSGGTISAPAISITSTSDDVEITSATDVTVEAPGGEMAFTAQGNVFFTSQVGNVALTASEGAAGLGGQSIALNALSGNIVLDATTNPSNITLQAAGAKITLNATHVSLPTLAIFANNAAAIAGGLNTHDLYRTGADPDVVCVVH